MFGTITPNTKSLSEAEKARYQSVYCGLCYSLRDRYSQVARFCLTYDMTFLVLLLSSLYEPAEKDSECKCVFQPGKSKTLMQNEYSDYAADMTVLLAYHKFMDDLADADHKMRGQIGKSAMQGSYEEARSRHPETAKAIEAGMKQIAKVESDDLPGGVKGDEVSKVFGLMLAVVFCPHDDMWRDNLARFGANLGRFIYYMDAALDMAKDKKSGAFNPYLEKDGPNGATTPRNAKQLRQELSILAGAATQEFEKLPLIQDEKILQNIMYEGMWNSFNLRFSKSIKKRVGRKKVGRFSRRADKADKASSADVVDKASSTDGASVSNENANSNTSEDNQ